jgi:glutathione peroxidase
MRRRAFLTLAAAAALAGAARSETTAHAFAFESIEGGALPLSRFAGRALLVVNTASRCGYTYQYEALQALWERYRDRGLTVLGVPSDQFRQELSSEAEVKDFCETNFAIDFPLTAITPVAGRGAHPFFAWAAEQAGAPRWNFHKYLVDPAGRLVAGFGTGVEPTAPELTEAVDRILPQA